MSNLTIFNNFLLFVALRKGGLPMETLAMVFLILVAATCYIRNYDNHVQKTENHKNEDNKK